MNHCDEEEIVKFGKFLIKHKIKYAKEIYEVDKNIFKEFEEEFKNTNIIGFNFEEHEVYLPYDLIEELKEMNNCHLVGGGRDECLQEISLLLQIIDVEHKILDEYCY